VRRGHLERLHDEALGLPYPPLPHTNTHTHTRGHLERLHDEALEVALGHGQHALHRLAQVDEDLVVARGVLVRVLNLMRMLLNASPETHTNFTHRLTMP
jgi:hypothetical protein